MKNKVMALALGAAVSAMAAGAASAGTLDDVKQKGFIQCGVSQGLIGFSNPDEQNNWTGMDVDFCRAVAAAVFGLNELEKKVKYTPLNAKERFTALQSGEIDILSRNTTWTMSRDTSLGLKFAGVMYYDGQGFLINKAKFPDVTSALQLGGAAVCTQTGTTTELNLADYFKANNMEYKVVAFEKNEEVLAAYKDGRCDVFTTDQSGLYAERLKFATPDDHVVLPEIISKEPLGPVVRQGDDAWFNVAKWTYFALLNAEELGVNSKNVENIEPAVQINRLDDAIKAKKEGADPAKLKELIEAFEKKVGKENVEPLRTLARNPEIIRLVGVANEDGSTAGFGTGIGLDEAWAVNIIKGVGNYAEIFERHVGEATPLKIARGKNALWRDGGLQYAPPIR